MIKTNSDRKRQKEKSLTRPPAHSRVEFYVSGAWIYRNSALETTLRARILREVTPLLEEMVVELSAAGVSEEGFSRPKLQNFLRERAAHRLEEQWSSEGWWPPRIDLSARDAFPERWPKELCQEVVVAYGEMEGISSPLDVAIILNDGALPGSDCFDRDIVRKNRDAYLDNLRHRFYGAPDVEREVQRSISESAKFLRSLRLIEWCCRGNPELRMFHGAALAIELDERFGFASCVDSATKFIEICDARGLSELDEETHEIAYREQKAAEIRAYIRKRDALGVPW